MPGPARSAFLSRTSVLCFAMERPFYGSWGKTRAQGKHGSGGPGGRPVQMHQRPVVRLPFAYDSRPRRRSAMSSAKPTVPASGAKITISGGKLQVPDRPIVPFIEGDGTGPDIWRASVRVLDAAVEKAYSGKRKIEWMEVYAGQKSFDRLQTWLPDETIDAFREYLVGIKGPLTTPIGGGIRSLNVALRQMLDLYVCLRPVQYFAGVPSPVKYPERVNMVIFRENTEDIYAGIEWKAGTPEAQKVIQWLQKEMGVTKIRFPESS